MARIGVCTCGTAVLDGPGDRRGSGPWLSRSLRSPAIDYMPAVTGHLRIVPEGEALEALAADYANMLADAVMVGEALPFDQLMQACGVVEARANEATAT